MLKTEVFQKNLQAMVGANYKELKAELEQMQTLKRYAYDFDKNDALNANIFDKKTKSYLYKEPLNELKESLKPYEDEFRRYPCLFFYGMGNGFFYKALLQNEEHKRIVVYEQELELIFMALNLVDFSDGLLKGRLILINDKNYSVAAADKIFNLFYVKIFFKIYSLRILSDYYEKNFIEEIDQINSINIACITHIASKSGNDPKDAMAGIENATLNLPYMLTHPLLTKLVKQRKNKGKYAILVATGPSLHKQLPLLKKYANKATIFCADSSYSILYEHGIKPDYILSLERVELTSKFFEKDYKEFDKDIIFILFSLTHPKTIEYLERSKRTYILTQRNLHYSRYLNLKDFGFLGGGMSVMNMAYEVAIMLGFKDIILIGQDLAFGKDGQTHTQNYMIADYHKDDFQTKKLIKVPAYGGVGEVYTTIIWLLFKEIYEGYIEHNKKIIKTYNATEGGARIEGSIEKPFKEICEEFLAPLENKKKLAMPKKPTRKESNAYMLEAYEKIKKGLKNTNNFIKECKKTLKKIQNFTKGSQKHSLEDINKSIDKIKNRLEKPNSRFFNEILSPSLFHQESQFAPLYVQNIKNESDRQNKLIAWIFSHEAWIEEITSFLEVLEQRVKVDVVALREKLEQRKVL